ncbi:helix-turn-helix domain-containing protein [Pseudomonas aeruginosa]|uniref:helix-turn-helix domain-containing protein n=1 Tax=Pseudomonas aeruginosa TaxID=287 RepID=UPI0035A8E0EA
MSISTEEREFFIALGERITRLRKEHGITQTQLAELLGVSQQTIQAYETGRRRIQVSTLPELARLLSTSLEELFGQEQETTPRKRGPAPKWQQQLEVIDQLPKSQQRLIVQMLNALIAQAARTGDEGKEVLQ